MLRGVNELFVPLPSAALSFDRRMAQDSEKTNQDRHKGRKPKESSRRAEVCYFIKIQ